MESNSLINRALTIIGFIVLLILAVWLAVKIVQYMPKAFSSLAALLESNQSALEEQNHLNTSVDKDTVNSSGSFVISWSDIGKKGEYSLSYECTNGVSMEMRIDGDIVKVDCDSNFILPANTFSVETIVVSTDERFVDVPYSINFTKKGDDNVSSSADGLVTVVNATAGTVDNTDNTETETETETTDTTTTTGSNGGTTPTPTPIQYHYVTTYSKPVSDPNGYTDLKVEYLGVGIVSGEKFIEKTSLDTNERGAVRFKVTNIGTKTSSDWKFSATLPSGDGFDSKTQKALEPSEYSVLTIAFDTGSRDGNRTLKVEITGGGDSSNTNNNINTTVKIVD